MTEAPVRSLPLPGPVDVATSSLFLDFDGTLIALEEDPHAVHVDTELAELFGHLIERFEGRVAIVTGRSLEGMSGLMGPIAERFAMSGSHGAELRCNGIIVNPDRPAALEAAAIRLGEFADRHPGVILEIKSFGVGLHFRRAPDCSADAITLVQAVANDLGLAYQSGSMMAEARVGGSNKGTAVTRLMSQAPMAGTTPIFLGDDDTDEPALAATAALGGVAVAVGLRPSASAQFRLPDTAAVRRWLAVIAGLEERVT